MATPSSTRFRQHLYSNPGTPRTYASTAVDAGQTTPPSLSATVPFDWEAARNGGPAPYGNAGTPIGTKPKVGKGRKSNVDGVTRNRVVRQAGWFERLSDLPSRMLFELQMFPQNLPLPPPKHIGLSIGAFLNVFHVLITYMSEPTQIEADDWADFKAEIEPQSNWTSWWTIIKGLLVLVAFGNAFYIFTRVKAYHLHLQKDLVNSPNAAFVKQDLDLRQRPPLPLLQRFFRALGRRVRVMWNFLKGCAPGEEETFGREAVQRLDIWDPPEREMSLLITYSPVHALMYPLQGWYQVITSIVILLSTSSLLYLMTSWYDVLIKDRAILAGEVMHEYDQKFVNPRMNVIRKDACVMTHEAEMVDWRSQQPHYSHGRNPVYQDSYSSQQRQNPGPARPFQAPEQGQHATSSPKPLSAPRKSVGRPREVVRF